MALHNKCCVLKFQPDLIDKIDHRNPESAPAGTCTVTQGKPMSWASGNYFAWLRVQVLCHDINLLIKNSRFGIGTSTHYGLCNSFIIFYFCHTHCLPAFIFRSFIFRESILISQTNLPYIQTLKQTSNICKEVSRLEPDVQERKAK
jgi:hypothetical protein